MLPTVHIIAKLVQALAWHRVSAADGGGGGGAASVQKYEREGAGGNVVMALHSYGPI